MPTFKYKAISKDGAPVSGVVEAYDELVAVQIIKETCSVVTKIAEVVDKSQPKEVFTPAKVKDKVLAIACSQLAIILRSGLPIVRSVELIANQTTDRTLKKILSAVAADVAAGHGLAASFENKGGSQLPSTFIETIRAGEDAGTLDIAFAKLHSYFDKSSKIKAKVISSLTYPAFLIVVAVIVVIIIMVKAVPMFTSLFASMGSELPMVTKILIATSNFFSSYILYILAVIIALVIVGKLWQRSERGRVFFAKLALRLPIIGKVNRMQAASQFANTMSTLLSAGLPVTRAVTSTGRAMNNYFLGRQVMDSVSAIESGRRLGDAMRRGEFFPEMLVEMTAVGEETGALESTLDVIGEYYDSQVELTTTRALSLLEPAIILMLAIFVVFILLAVYLPIFGMYSGLV